MAAARAEKAIRQSSVEADDGRRASMESRIRSAAVPGSQAERRVALLSVPRIQPALKVSSSGDAAEREAERVARAVMTMPAPATPAPQAAVRSPLIAARAPAAAPPPAAAADAKTEADIRQASSGGAQLSAKTRAFFEPRFKANFGAVRIHTDAKAANLATRLGARAFTFGRHIFFNAGQYRPETREGMELLAHELTHTIQQTETVQRQSDEAVQAPRVAERSGPVASRLGISDALDYFADAANAIPGFRMFTILIGVNPINMSRVEASAANILRAIVEFLPGGNAITRVLDSYGIFDRIGSWIEGQLRTLGISGASIRAAIDRFLDSLSWRDIFDLGGVWRRAKAIFTDPISRIIAFARSLFGEILRFVREAVLRPLAALAEGTRGYPLLKAVLGQDPVTGEPFPRTAETVIGGFLTLIGQEELWQNIQRANAIPRAWTWFQGALGGLVSLVRSIPSRFMAALRDLEITDFLILPRAFARLAQTFGGFLADFGRWALGTVLDLLRIIIEVVAPGVMPYLRRAAGAFTTIVRNPVRFVQTLVRAAIQGFRQFAGNFLTHLRASLIGWLTGAMAGANIYIPQGFNLREILKFVLSVLGLTWANIRGRLVRATNETVVRALETGFDIVRVLVTEGPAAAWQKILETLTNLRDIVIEQVMEFVRSRVVQAAVTRLLSMLSPAGALIQAIIAIYNTIMFFVERLRQIAQVAASFIDAIATIAAGNIAPAANRVERTMAGLLTLVISFLARIAGLGRVADAVTGVINRVRQPIDRALDRVVAWIVAQARRLGQFIAQAGVPHDPNQRLRQAANAAVTAARRLTGRVTAGMLDGVLAAIRVRYALTSVTPFQAGGTWRVRLTINPTLEQGLPITTGTGTPAAPASGPASTDPQIQRYELILSRLSIPLITGVTNPDTYRDRMRTAIVQHYSSRTIVELNTQVFQAGIIPRSLNRIRGDIFEMWLSQKGAMQRQSPIFVHPSLFRKRIADGVIGTSTLVDAKVRRPNTRPDPEARRQMTDYGLIITQQLKAVNVADTVERGPFTKVRYIFSDANLVPLWQPILLTNVGAGRYETA